MVSPEGASGRPPSCVKLTQNSAKPTLSTVDRCSRVNSINFLGTVPSEHPRNLVRFTFQKLGSRFLRYLFASFSVCLCVKRLRIVRIRLSPVTTTGRQARYSFTASYNRNYWAY